MTSSRKRHKSTPTRKDLEFKAKMRLATLAGLERGQSIHELKLDTTPEGIVAFGKLMIEKIGRNEIDLARSSNVNAWIQTLIRVTESGIDALKNIEEDALHLAQTVRINNPNTPKPTS